MDNENETFDFESQLDEAQKEQTKGKKVSEQELIDKYKKFYDKNKALKMLKELRKKTRTMPSIVRGPTHVVIELLGHLISALDNPALSKKQKALVMGAIGYIVTPIDLISDLIPVIGFVDDIASTVIIVQTIRKYSTFKMQQLDELIDSELSSNDETDKNDKLENNKKDGE